MFKKTVQRGRSEQRGESYSAPYVEPLSDARTMLEGLFQHPASSETYGILGRVYKDRWEAALKAGDKFLARGLLGKTLMPISRGSKPIGGTRIQALM